MMLLFRLPVTADACFMAYLICLFMKTHLPTLLQGNCLDLVHYAFLHKLSGCMSNITAFGYHLLRPNKSAVLANTDISVQPKYRPYISAWSIYQSISSKNFSHLLYNILNCMRYGQVKSGLNNFFPKIIKKKSFCFLLLH